VIAGEKGTIHLWPGVNYLDLYPVSPSPATQFVSLVRPYWLQEKLMSPTLQRRRIKLGRRDMTGYLGEMEEFISAVAEERPPVTPATDARRDLEIVMSCYEALRTGRPATIPPISQQTSS
jgi:predicted dehydrogenase